MAAEQCPGAGDLSDVEVVRLLLSGEVFISPLVDPSQIGSGIDLRLSADFIVRRMDRLTYFDPVWFADERRRVPYAIWRYYERVIKPDPLDPFILHPNQFVLGSTLEHVYLPDDISGTLQGRSGWAREGLMVHSTASFIHPGHNGNIVFELRNNGTHPIPLYTGVRVAQLRLSGLRIPNATVYGEGKGAKYSDNIGTSFGRPWEDWEFEHLATRRRTR
jgi:dCTP deaminase